MYPVMFTLVVAAIVTILQQKELVLKFLSFPLSDDSKAGVIAFENQKTFRIILVPPVFDCYS